MNPYLSDADFTLYNGDAREGLRELPAESVHMCVTSPPFFGLRDYGVADQIGLESTPEEWVAQLVSVFEEVKRVLRKDGTLWVECGDSYSGSWSGHSIRPEGGEQRAGGPGFQPIKDGRYPAKPTKHPGCKPKDLIGQPFLL
ncbi:MAG TPA: DNA methyltransferase, partial [Steroidobacteraceae bacterium]|nr:DNA methyltransferase [Steroidobacteraceae bacterium]